MIFTSEDVQSRLREQPFRPVRIVTTTGQTKARIQVRQRKSANATENAVRQEG
jgi:hypothetical protein